MKFLISALEFALSFTNLAAVWIGVRVWEAKAGKLLPADIEWTLYFAAFVSTSFWNWRKERLRAQAAEEMLAEQTKQVPIRRFAPDGEAVLRRYGQIGMGAERLLTPYLDQWIRVCGSFEGAAESLIGDATFVSVLQEDGRRLHLRFPGGDRNVPGPLRKGQVVTAACQIRHGYGAGAFVLDNCELLEAEPALRHVS